MAKDKKHITTDNINEWLGSLGFLFPRDHRELGRFDKLYKEYDHELSGDILDPKKIMAGDFENIQVDGSVEDQGTTQNWRMAARNFENIPEHILKKMKRNQDNGDTDSEEETN
ncbi:hypothetical protein GCM10009122_33110 [Fulvivirga kasyanovii]|jgi:hypothetical protein|uniref:Uncharacterized protein n=2 Tax=Cytophagales TaxID=768507 RepID=A0AA49GNU1_9BACT|nr:hypothetical protein [Fulvivirga kasyanovii]MTI27813.1 hypothetical protein [Fulvivirga kasyanovii]WKN36000.1 hypothetical protein K4G66_26905 [Tunicatimonas sp. TK19036]HNP17025.1 hypothetical protein [Fulvivirga sp.]